MNQHKYEGYKGKIEQARELVRSIQAEARERHCSHILVMGDYCLSTLTNFELALDHETDYAPERVQRVNPIRSAQKRAVAEDSGHDLEHVS